jgi:hypothetical protein
MNTPQIDHTHYFFWLVDFMYVFMCCVGEETVCVSFPEENEVKVFNEKGREKTWEFDEVFTTESTQESVYAEVSDLVTSVLDGYNICIFAYGQTGSG